MIEILVENIYVQSLTVGLILAYVYFQLLNRVKLNEPPLAYYRFPIIGHTWSFLTDCEKLITESRKKYGETFSLYVFGQIMTIVGKETTSEVLKKDQDFSFREGLRLQVPLHFIFTRSNPDKNIKILREFLTGKLKHLTSRLQKNVIKAMDIYIGECVEPKVIENPHELLSHIVSFPVANIVVGEECYYNEDILEAFRDLTSSIFKLFIAPPILSFIHPWLHQQFVTIPLRFGWNPASKHFDVIIKRIRPVVEKRLNDKKRLGDAWVAPLDVLQYYLNDPDITPDLDPNHVDYVYIANAIGSFIFAAMGTTTSTGARALYDLATRKEYWQELYQEAQEINKQCNGNELTIDDIAKMVKLDSFVKESLRFTGGVVAMPHKCVTKSHYTFENGYQIRNGTVVMFNMLDTAYDEELQGQNPTEFKAYRHLDRNSPATKLERNFIIFGGGKHACPGRSLAVNEIKVFLHKVMLKYNVSIENEKVIKKYLGPIPRRFKASFVFENRKDVVVN